MPITIPERYGLYNAQSVKKIGLVVKIAGVDGYLSNRPTFTRIRYGDPIVYGEGYVYGGLRQRSDVRDYLSLDGSSLTLSQKIEPEQGKGSVSMLTLAFIDKDSYMTQLISPGIIVDEILGREVQVFLGYEEISFPEDYFQIFRGYISGVTSASGLVTLQLSDPNLKKRQNVFYTAQTKLTSTINSSVTSIPVAATGDFHKQILGPDATYDSGILTYIKIGDEFMQYGPAGIPSVTSFTVTRGARGTTAASHDADSDVSAYVQVSDHMITMALKLMLSGWNGTWIDSVECASIVDSTDPSIGDIPSALVLGENVDAKAEYGLTIGDYVTISGSGIGGNNVTGVITSFEDLFETPNRIIILSVTLYSENPTAATLAFRSKYDTYPLTCGLKMTPKDVDVDRHESIKSTYLGGTNGNMRFLISAQESGKSFIESQLFLPVGAYSVTRNGRISAAINKPPLAEQTLQTLDASNILDPQNIRPSRSVNGRKFFNDIVYKYDYNDAGNPASIKRVLDSDSLSLIGVSSSLPITARGARTDLGTSEFFDERAQLFLTRYKRGAVEIGMKVNWAVGNLIEASDTVLLRDNGGLQISNFSTGERDLGDALFEVTERTLDLKDGSISLKLLNGVGFEFSDRYATIAPSSDIASGSTTTEIIIQDSYQSATPGNEQSKWDDYLGLLIRVHSIDYSFDETVTLISFDTVNPYKMNVTALSSPPAAGYIVDIVEFPTSTDPAEQSLYKLIHAYLSPSVVVTAGISSTSFTVGAGDIAKFSIGDSVLVHNSSWSIESPETTVLSILGNDITVTDALGFTPAAGQRVEYIGFADDSAAYRYI